MHTVNIILGPTSSGKTSLAVKLCKKFNGEIISADSRQIYKKMDIGTGKVPITGEIKVENFVNYWLLDDVVVWGYDLVNPDEYFSAYDYAQYALAKTKGLIERGKEVFLVGGTGFYIDIFTGHKKPSQIPPNFKLRDGLKKLDINQLQEKLTSLNPEKLDSIDKNNPARLMRAIEIEMTEKKSTSPLPYLKNTKFNFIGLTSDRELLYDRADKWLDTIWRNGLIDEVKVLQKSGYKDSQMLNGLIYKSAIEFLDGKDEDTAIQEAKFDLHAYIRRQQTYFKKMPSIEWFEIQDSELFQKIQHNVESK